MIDDAFKQRFWSKVDKSGDCWEWTASRLPAGYGRFAVNGQMTTAHRVSYELKYGPIPTGLHVLHKCDNPPCVTPDHLFLGTQQDNMRDKISKGRQPVGESVYQAKLTDGDIRIIRGLAEVGCKQSHIADFLGICRQIVSDIVLNKTWKHVLTDR